MNVYPPSTGVTLKAVFPAGSSIDTTEANYSCHIKIGDIVGFLSPPAITFTIVSPTSTTEGYVSCYFNVGTILETTTIVTINHNYDEGGGKYYSKAIATFYYRIKNPDSTTIVTQGIFK